MKNCRGFTAVEAIVLVCMIGVVLLIVAAFFRSCLADYSGANKDKATEEAQAYARTLKFNPDSVSCMAHDTDRDGYVSCTISTVNEKGETHLVPIECATAFSWNDGCKMQKNITR